MRRNRRLSRSAGPIRSSRAQDAWDFGGSMPQAAAELKKTPLNSVHRRMGARMVDFGGWDMPVQYSGILEEHNAVRQAVGLFDVSHMGEIEIRGPEALALTDYVSCNN